MIPIKSNTNKENCVPVSSNCVIWQGPNLPCIGLCTGDSVSDVIYRVAVEVCDLKDSFGFTDVDLTCLLTICTTVPEPQKTLSAILNLVINKVCCLSDITNEIIAQINATPTEMELILANCFHVTNPQGVPLTVLPISAYVTQIGIKICDEIVPVLASHSATLISLQTQINNIPDPTPIPDVVPNCLTGNGVIPNVPTPIDVVVEELERQFCVLTNALGPSTEIIKVSGQCNLSNTPTDLNEGNFLSTGLPLVSAGNWNTTPVNLAETLQNLWLIACDLRGAVKLIQDNCCKISCKDILVNFDVLYSQTTDQATGKPQITLTLFFGVDGVNIPSTFYDCDQTNFTELTITDQHGHSVRKIIKIRDITNQTGILDDPLNLGNGYDLVLLGTSLNPKDDLTITADVCLTDGTTTCIKCLNIYVPYVLASCDFCKIDASCNSADNTGYAILSYIDNSTKLTQTTTIHNCESIIISQDITPVGYALSGQITITSKECPSLISAFEAVQENIVCFAFPIAASYTDQGGGSTQNYHNLGAFAFIYNDVEIPISPFGFVNGNYRVDDTTLTNNFKAAINSVPSLANVINNVCVKGITQSRGREWAVWFTAPLSIAANFKLLLHGEPGSMTSPGIAPIPFIVSNYDSQTVITTYFQNAALESCGVCPPPTT